MGEVFVPFPQVGDSDAAANERIITPRGGLDAKIVRQSRVVKTLAVQPTFDGTGGNSRFAVAHGLGATPDHIEAQVRRIVGFNEDSVQAASIAVQPCDPYADSKLSYFTVGLLCPAYHEYQATLDGGGNISRTFDAKWGKIKGAVIHATTGSLAAGPFKWSRNVLTQRILTIDGPAADAGEAVNFSVFFGLPPGTIVEIECLSEIREVWVRNLNVANGSEAFPVP